MNNPDVVVVGTVAYDIITTPYHKKTTVLGGSATYFALSSNHFSDVGLVSVVGRDFKDSDLKLLKDKGIDTTGLEVKDGKTFLWEGEYDKNLIDRRTIKTELNVFGEFNPVLPGSYKRARFALLGNGTPQSQLSVFEQMDNPELVLLDTMNYWIEQHRAELDYTISKIKTLSIDKSEALLLSGQLNAKNAVRTLFKRYDLKLLLLKLAEYGAIVFTKDFQFLSPAHMNEKVVDPTGCGDSFAGGFLGYLSKKGVNNTNLKYALINACVMGSFACEEFGPARLYNLRHGDIEQRAQEILRTISI